MKLVPADILQQYGVVLIVNLSMLTTGISLAWPSPMLVKLRDSTTTPLSRPITEEEGSWLVSIGFLCGLLINLVSGMLLDSLGRKRCILLASIPKVFVGLLFVYATEVWMLIFGRALVMMLNSILYTAVPVYASEIANVSEIVRWADEKEQRGALGTMLQIFISLGILVTLSVGPFTSFTTFNIIYTVCIVVTTIPLLFLPDSPYFLYSKGCIEEATKVLTTIRRSDLQVKEELDSYEKSLQSKVDVSKLALIRSKTFQKSLIPCLILGIGGQFLGFNSVSLYLQTILESTHVSVKPEYASVIMGLIQLIASFCATPVTSSFGRKTILLWSFSGYFVGVAGLGTFFKITEGADYVITGFMNYLPIVSLVLVVFCNCIGMGSLFWLIAAEMFDGQSRAFGVSLSIFAMTVMVFLTTKYFVFLSALMGPAEIYWLFSAATIVFAVIIATFLPETKGKTFSEIQKSLHGSKAEEIKSKNINQVI